MELKGQKFIVVREFRPRLSSLTRLQTNCCMSKAKKRKGGSKRSRGREGVQMRGMIAGGKGEVKAWPSLPFPGNKSKAPPAAAMYRERDEGKRKTGKMEGLKVVVGGRKVFGDMEMGGWMSRGVQVFGYTFRSHRLTFVFHTESLFKDCYYCVWCCGHAYWGGGKW